MGRGMPHAAQPATGLNSARQDRPDFSQLYWQQRKARDISADKHASYIFISLMIGVLFHHIALLWRQEGVLINAMVAVMLLHVTGECCFSYCISKHVKVYIEHRTRFVMTARMAFQACMLYYVPRTWRYTVPVQLAANKHMAQTYRLLFAYTSSNLLETLAYPLPMQAAVPYHVTRALLYGCTALPQLVHVIITHEALAITAQRIRVEMTDFYGSAVGLILGADLPGVRETTVAHLNFVVAGLVVFVHIAFGLAVPLYILGVMQSFSQKAFAQRLQADAGIGSNSSSPATAAMPGGTADNSAHATAEIVGSSRSGRVSADVDSNAAAEAQSVADEVTGTAITSSARAGSRLWHTIETGIGLHAVILFCVTMLLWALSEFAVSLWASLVVNQQGVCSSH